MDLSRLIITIVALVFSLGILRTVSCQSYEDATNLRSTLLTDYHKDVRPLNDQSRAVNVNVTLDVFGMPEVDDVGGVITITVATKCVWIDERMTWNPADHGGISKIPILINEVWTPSISLGTPVEFATMGSANTHVTFYFNGLAIFYPGNVLHSSCRFNMRYWPFDKQICDVGFFPLDYSTDQVLFSVPSGGIQTVSYSPHAEWTLDGTEHYDHNIGDSSLVYFRFKLIRQSVFYILTIILPINGIAGLTCLVFLLPSESGERVSYAITIMLSLAVFLTVVSAEMPKSSEPISLMCCYILAGIVVSVIGTVLAILNLSIYHRSENVPKKQWYISLVNFSRCRRSNQVGDHQEELYDQSNTKDTKISKQNPITIKVKTNVYEQKHIDSLTWKDVSHAIDKVLFYAMVILTYIPSIGFLIYIGAASDYQL